MTRECVGGELVRPPFFWIGNGADQRLRAAQRCLTVGAIVAFSIHSLGTCHLLGKISRERRCVTGERFRGIPPGTGGWGGDRNRARQGGGAKKRKSDSLEAKTVRSAAVIRSPDHHEPAAVLSASRTVQVKYAAFLLLFLGFGFQEGRGKAPARGRLLLRYCYHAAIAAAT